MRPSSRSRQLLLRTRALASAWRLVSEGSVCEGSVCEGFWSYGYV